MRVSEVTAEGRKIAERVGRFVREVVVPFEKDPRWGSHGPSDELVVELRGMAAQADVLTPHMLDDGCHFSRRDTALVLRAAGCAVNWLCSSGIGEARARFLVTAWDKRLVLRDYDGIVGTNLKGEFMMGRAVIEQMLKQGKGGEIVNVATDHMVTCGSPNEICPNLETCPWGTSPRPTGGGDVMDIYDASKWGLNGFLFAWAKALRPHNIRVNALCMGATDSWMIRDFYGFTQIPGEEENEEQKEEVATWMAKKDTARVLIDLLKEGPEGRIANNINLCVGRPPALEPPLPPIYVLEGDLHV